jgi:hypothetical protein
MPFVFGATPAIFTKTVIEAIIQEQGVSAQAALASILTGTPILVAAAAAAWAFHAYRATVAATVGGQGTGLVLSRLLSLTLTMVVGWSMLGTYSRTGLSMGPLDAPGHDQTWREMGSGPTQPHLEQMGRTKPLWGFAMINGAFEQATALMTGAVGVSPEEDPGQLIKSLVKLQATTLGEASQGGEVLSAFDALARNCGRSDARILPAGGRVQDLFVTSTEVVGTNASGNDIDCAMLWRDFEEATAQVAVNAHQEAMGEETSGWELGARFGWNRFFDLGAEWYGLEEDETFQWGLNAMIEGTLRDAAKRSATGVNPLRKDEATFSEGWPDYIVDVLVDGAVGETALNVGSLFVDNLHLKAQKAAAAARFNEIADLIPTMRGFLHATFAVAFPLCAYALALGWSVPMRNWLVGRAVLALYMPIAHLLYAMVDSFAGWNGIADNPDYAWLASESTVVGGLALLEAETLRVQTAYLMCEVAVFSSFALGSVRSLLLGGFSHVGTGAGAFATGVGTSVGTALGSYELFKRMRPGSGKTAPLAGAVSKAGPQGPGPGVVAVRSVVTAVGGSRRLPPPASGAIARRF